MHFLKSVHHSLQTPLNPSYNVKEQLFNIVACKLPHVINFLHIEDSIHDPNTLMVTCDNFSRIQT
jgi:hypothetical protein